MSGLRSLGTVVAALALVAGCSASQDLPNLTTRFGLAVQAEDGESPADALGRADARFGPVDLVRVYYRGVPDAWPGKAPGRDAIVSFKLDPDEVLAGTFDDQMRTWFATVPEGLEVYWSYWHEPEDDVEAGTFTAEEFAAAFAHLDGLADEAKRPNLHSTLVLMSWSTDPASGRDWRAYLPEESTFDVLAWDVYNRAGRRGSYATPADLIRRPAEASASLGKPFAVAEFGSVLVDGDEGSGRATWLKEMATALNERGAVFASYFDFLWNDGADDYRLRDPASVEAWRSIVAAQKPPQTSPEG